MDIVEVTDLGNGHKIEYYPKDGVMRVKETCGGHVLDLTITEYMHADSWEMAKYFALGPQYSTLCSGPTNLGSP
jgi:hypothetical protein